MSIATSLGRLYEDLSTVLSASNKVISNKGGNMASTYFTLPDAINSIQAASPASNTLRAAATAKAESIRSKQSGSSFTFAFLSDLHCGNSSDPNNTSITHAAQALEVISETCHIDAIVFGGDIASGEASDTKQQALDDQKTAAKLFHNVATGVPTLWLKGNSDDAPYQNRANGLTDDEVYSVNGIRNTRYGVVLDDAAHALGYGYLDFPSHKLRLIYLNTADKSALGDTSSSSAASAYHDAHHISKQQLNWLVSNGLDLSSKQDPTKWNIIICCHSDLNINSNYPASSGMRFCGTSNAAIILDAFINGTSGSISVDSGSVAYNFSTGAYAANKRANLLFIVHGHDHALSNGKIGTNNILSVGCPNVMNGREQESSDGVVYSKSTGDTSDTSFCILTVDTNARKLYADCFGAGCDRYFDI